MIAAFLLWTACNIELPPAEDCASRVLYYLDSDQDGLGDPTTGQLTCTIPEGHVSNNGDCDDADPVLGEDCGDTGGGGDSGDTGDIKDTGGGDSGDTAGETGGAK